MGLPIDGEIVEQLATDIALHPRYPHEAAQVAALPDCPEDLVAGLIDQATRGNPHVRSTAAAFANTAPAHRRDKIVTQLLRMSRKGKILDELLTVITRPEGTVSDERISWLRHHPDLKVRRLCTAALGPEPAPESSHPVAVPAQQLQCGLEDRWHAKARRPCPRPARQKPAEDEDRRSMQ